MKKVVSISIDPPVLAKARKAATKEGRSLSSMIQSWIENSLKKGGAK